MYNKNKDIISRVEEKLFDEGFSRTDVKNIK